MIAYQSAWLREHYAPEFLCALLNEQPMGFYPPDSLVHEAQRRGVLISGVDVNRSEVLCRVEREAAGRLAVRVRLGYVKGLPRRRWRHSSSSASAAAPTAPSPSLPLVPELPARAWSASPGRRRSTTSPWRDGARRPPPRRLLEPRHPRRRADDEGGNSAAALPLEAPPTPQLAPLDRWQRIVEDYRATGINLGEHPLALLRMGLGPDALRSSDLAKTEDGATVEVAGMVVARQRPETAKGITFMLLEDERGTVNVIVAELAALEWRRVLWKSSPSRHNDLGCESCDATGKVKLGGRPMS